MIGKVLGGRYEIVELVGTGGMAYVYKAKCRLLNRNVAIKILKEEYNNDTDFVSKFYVESQSAASLSNVNIVSVYDVGEQDNLKYIVMEYVEGITLKEIIKQQRILEWNVAVNCCLQILNALECAHKNGIVHRDIKPHNILVTNDGVLKVADFGIAKAVNSSDTKKIDEDVVGSVHYISPEQAKGIMIDSRSDLYSLGIVMYEMLTGKLPFDGENPVSVALMHLNSEPVPIKDVNIAVPLELSQIVKKAMSRDVNKRYQSAKEMAHDLIEFKKHMKNNAFTTNKNADELAQNPIDVPSDNKINSEADENEIFKTIVKKPSHTDNSNAEKIVSHENTATDFKNNANQKMNETADNIETNGKIEKTKAEKSAVIAAVAVSVVIITGMFVVFANIFFKGTPISEFFINVFRGKEYYLEDFTGKDYNESIEILDNDGIEYTISSEENNEEYEDNVILRQDPAGGKNIKLKKNTVIRFVVNNKENEEESDVEKTKVRVPAVVGQEFSVAEKMITELGLKCVKETSDSSEGDKNYVIRQSPDSGEMLSQGSTVIVFVPALDEGLTIVSKYTGMVSSEAKKYAEFDGLKVELKNRETKEKAEDGFVVEQSITHGTEVEKGAKIIFYVGVYRAEFEPNTNHEINYPNGDSGNSTPSVPENSSGGTMSSEEEFLPEISTKHIRIPIVASDKDRTITVLQDGVKISSLQFKAGSTNLPLTISGSGVSKLEIVADGTVVFTGTYDFSD